MSTEQNAKTRPVVMDGHVWLPLPGNQYIKMTPEQAQQLGIRLIQVGAEAEGKQVPSLIVLPEAGL